MSYTNPVRCVCGRKPETTDDHKTPLFTVLCKCGTPEVFMISTSPNKLVALNNWRILVLYRTDHLSRFSSTNASHSQKFVEDSLKPDPETGFGVRANNDADLRRVDFGNIEVLEDFRTFLAGGSGGTQNIGIQEPRNSLVAITRRFGGHASGGGGPC